MKRLETLICVAALAATIAAAQPARRALDLNGAWRLTYGPVRAPGGPSDAQPPADWPTIPATVPGNVELDLAAAGRLPRPEVGNRVYETRKLESYQWWYRREFTPPRLQAGAMRSSPTPSRLEPFYRDSRKFCLVLVLALVLVLE